MNLSGFISYSLLLLLSPRSSRVSRGVTEPRICGSSTDPSTAEWSCSPQCLVRCARAMGQLPWKQLNSPLSWEDDSEQRVKKADFGVQNNYFLQSNSETFCKAKVL